MSNSTPLDPQETRRAFGEMQIRVAALETAVKALTRKADSYSVQLEHVQMACAAAESQARVCKLDTDATSRLLNEALEQIRVLMERTNKEAR